MAAQISTAIARHLESVANGFEQFEGRPGHHFRRFHSPLFSIVVIQHSAKYRCFEVDVASTVFPAWDGQYAFHQLRRATGLANLRVRSGAINVEDVPYYYVVDRQEALERIADELRSYALPWFDDHRRDIANDALVRFGFAKLMNIGAEELTIDSLKWSLRDEAARIGASKWQRQQTKILATDLLRIAEQRRGNLAT